MTYRPRVEVYEPVTLLDLSAPCRSVRACYIAWPIGPVSKCTSLLHCLTYRPRVEVYEPVTLLDLSAPCRSVRACYMAASIHETGCGCCWFISNWRKHIQQQHMVWPDGAAQQHMVWPDGVAVGRCFCLRIDQRHYALCMLSAMDHRRHGRWIMTSGLVTTHPGTHLATFTHQQPRLTDAGKTRGVLYVNKNRTPPL